MKIGILGGSFNPVHTGHVRMAVEALEQTGLDRVELMPAKEPPHKRGRAILSFALRLEMVKRAIAGIPGLGANPIEGDRPGPSFTYDTLIRLRTEQPQHNFYFILGASTFLGVPGWERGLDILNLASLIVVNRWRAAKKVAGAVRTHWPEAVNESDGLWRFPEGTSIRLIDIPRLDIKGQEIRHRWHDRRDLSFLVPNGVKMLLEERAAEIEKCWGKRKKGA